MNATEIAAYFKSKVGLILSTKKIGEALKTLDAVQVKVRNGTAVLTKYALIDPDHPLSGEEVRQGHDTALSKRLSG